MTGQETIDIVTLPPGKTFPGTAVENISTQILKIPSGVTTTVRLALRNTGDVAVMHGPVTMIMSGLQSALGLNAVQISWKT